MSRESTFEMLDFVAGIINKKYENELEAEFATHV